MAGRPRNGFTLTKEVVMEGYILIQTELGRAGEAVRRIAALDGVVTVEAVTGAYDVVARATWSCESELVHCLEEQIESIPGVTRALACPLASHAKIWEMDAGEPVLADASAYAW